MKSYLSKSKYTAFHQCPKILWMKTYKPEDETIDPALTLTTDLISKKCFVGRKIVCRVESRIYVKLPSPGMEIIVL